jgi:hypothetical protein
MQKSISPVYGISPSVGQEVLDENVSVLAENLPEASPKSRLQIERDRGLVTPVCAIFQEAPRILYHH